MKAIKRDDGTIRLELDALEEFDGTSNEGLEWSDFIWGEARSQLGSSLSLRLPTVWRITTTVFDSIEAFDENKRGTWRRWLLHADGNLTLLSETPFQREEKV